MFLGYDFIGQNAYFQSPTSGIRDITFCEIENGIFDQINVNGDTTISLTDVKDSWLPSSRLLATFKNNSLDAGNISSGNGLSIVSLTVKRRKPSELLPITVKTGIPFINDTTMTYVDYTCPVGEYIYSISPVSSNSLEGSPIEVTTNSEFYGWYLVDRITGNTLILNRFVDSEPSSQTQLKQGRVVIETLNKYPQIYYTSMQYAQFSLTATITGDNTQTPGQKYDDIITNFVNNHKPFLVKNGNGQYFVCDVYNPQTTSPLNSGWNNRPYFNISLDFTEIMDLNDYLASY